MLSADGDLEGCAERESSSFVRILLLVGPPLLETDRNPPFQTLIKLKTCDVSTERGAFEATIFLRDLQIESEARLERIGNWLWNLRNLPQDPNPPMAGRKRSKASGTEKRETTAEKASEPEKGEKRKQAEGGRSGKSGGRAGKRKGHGGATTTTKAQHSTSHAQAGPGSINKYPAEFEGWDTLRPHQRRRKLIKWWRHQTEELQRSELMSNSLSAVCCIC
jgi:hypothetical protein